MGSGVLRTVGDTRRPVYFLIIACLTNIVLDMVLWWGWGSGCWGRPAPPSSCTVAAWTAHGKIDGFFWMIMSAYGISITTFAGQNFSAQRYDRVRESVRAGLLLSAGTSLILSVLYCGFAGPLLGIFTDDGAVLAIGVQIVWGMVPFYLTYVCAEILAGAIRGCGNALSPMLMTACGICLLRIVWVIAAVPFRRELSTILVSYPLSWGATSLLFILYYRRGVWLRRCISQSGAAA